MSRHSLYAGIALTALSFGMTQTAMAQSYPDVLNEQISIDGDIFSDLDVIIENDHDGDVTGNALAVGNAVSGEGILSGDARVESTQGFDGNAQSSVTMSGGRVFGTASGHATAYGNSAMGSQLQGEDIYQQTARDHTISATATSNGVSATSHTTSATATGNIQDISYENGTLNMNALQLNGANIAATNESTGCCTTENTTSESLAVANSYQSDAQYSNSIAIIRQSSEGENSTATTRLTQNTANDLTATSQAMGNNIVSSNSWGYSQLNGSQTNSAATTATTEVTLSDWDGTASISAYGVGNSVMQTNIGSDAHAYYSQTNSGNVISTAGFDGGAGSGSVSSSSTAIGNTYTGYVCATCAPAAPGGSLSQSNSASITASNQIRAGSSGNITGSSAAIGNSANFTAGRTE